MKKICIIEQKAGFGDIIFCQGIANHFYKLGYRIVWPIVKELLDSVSNLNSVIEFYDYEKDFPLKEMYLNCYYQKQILKNNNEDIFLPLGYAADIAKRITTNINDISIMSAKYTICDLSWNEWKNNLSFKRNEKKENELFYDVLKIKDKEDYIFYNQMYGTQPNINNKDISSIVKTFDLPSYELKIIDGFTLFDWCKVFENMHSTVIVDTSLMYILETLNLKNKNNFICVPRNTETVSQIKHLFNIPWKYTNE